MGNEESKFSGLTEKLGLQPKEQALLVQTKDSKLFIGIPKERTFDENRIALTPDAVHVLTANGHRIIMEHDAGKACGFSDHLYSEAGADITKNTEEVFQAETILKVAPPTLFEIELMKPGSHLISPIHLPSISKEYLYALMKRKINALAYEFINDGINNFPFVSAMSEIAGIHAIFIGSELLSNAHNGKGILLGGINGVPPAKIVILGAGVVGTYAARTALGAGAQISVFDNNIHKLDKLQDKIGQRIFTSIVSPTILKQELLTADIVIGAIHNPFGRTPVLVSEHIVEQMKPGSVIIDVSIDQGGCFDTSEMTTLNKPTFTKHDVIHYCVPNIPSRVAKTASYAFSHLLTPILFKAQELGGIKHLIHNDRGLCQGVYTYNGHLTQRHLANKYDIKYTNLDLVFRAGM